MERKAGIIVAVLILLAGLLSGCGDAQRGTAGENSAGSPGKTTDTDISSQDTGKVVELTLWGAEEDEALLNQMIEEFRQKYAEEAVFEITLEFVGESQCKDRLVEDPQGGADVFAFADDQLRVLVAAGLLARAEDEDGIRASNVEGAWQAASVNGRIYAYPMTAYNGYFIYYNKAYFSEEDVKTLDSILEKAAAAERKVTMDWTSGWYLYSFFGQTGMELGINDDGVSNYCNWNATDTAVRGIDVARALLDISSSPAFMSVTDTEFVAGVQNGDVIAGVSGVWNANTVEKAWGRNYGAVKLPSYTCGGRQVQMASFAGYKMVGVNAYSEHIEWAGKLAAWITNEENQTLRFIERGQGPSNINAANSPQVATSPAIQAVISQSEFANLQRVGGNYWEPVQIFGETMRDGNPLGRNLQELLDTMVQGITLSY